MRLSTLVISLLLVLANVKSQASTTEPVIFHNGIFIYAIGFNATLNCSNPTPHPQFPNMTVSLQTEFNPCDCTQTSTTNGGGLDSYLGSAVCYCASIASWDHLFQSTECEKFVQTLLTYPGISYTGYNLPNIPVGWVNPWQTSNSTNQTN